MLTKLPTVQATYCAPQQEESQRNILTTSPLTLDSSAMYVCTACGVKGNTKQVIEYAQDNSTHSMEAQGNLLQLVLIRLEIGGRRTTEQQQMLMKTVKI